MLLPSDRPLDFYGFLIKLNQNRKLEINNAPKTRSFLSQIKIKQIDKIKDAFKII